MTKRPSTILLLIFFFNFIPSVLCAAEMSSKRDCVLCHIMWMDDFRTDKETLIAWQPENVLMKDTQGVVSSQEICYSCHDGYVVDSRFEVWENSQHKTFVKPSKNITIPSTLTLSSKDEIYCGTCHSAHGAGAAPSDTSSGQTSFFREKNTDSSLCEMCHKNETDFKRTKGHPIHTNKLKIPDILFEYGANKAKEQNSVICQSCHKVHGAKGKKISIVENKNSELCLTCHSKKQNLIKGKHDLRFTFPDSKNIKQQSTEEQGPCSACHTPHNAAADRLWARQIKPGHPASQMCLECHGEDTGYKIKNIGKYSHPIDVAQVSKTSIKNKLPLFMDDLKKNSFGRIQCFTCHDVHKWDPNSYSNNGRADIEGDASNSFLRVSGNRSSKLCLACHEDKIQLINSDHNLKITAPTEKNIQSFTADDSGPCGGCHIPHNALSSHLWSRKLSKDKDLVSEFCISCHSKKGAAKEKLIGNNYHPVDVTLDKAKISTSGMEVIKLLPLYNNEANRLPDGKMVCLTCHEPHTWNPVNPEPTINDLPINIEGDTTNSFLRKANFPSSDLCTVCHADKALVDGTDHDLNVTGQQAVNLLGQTVKESGQCGVCHLVHNSPNKLKLWARSYGPVPENNNIMNALCTSCHSKGAIAETKIPAVATHPDGKLINNIMRSRNKGEGYIPIFDRDGKARQYGDVSCPSCHDSHQWWTSKKEKGPNKNLEGNAKSSFLRNVSYQNVCAECHGEDALFRYRYFHVLEKRPMSLHSKQLMQKTISDLAN